MSRSRGRVERATGARRRLLLRFALHPVVVHVPLALLLCASTADAIALLGGDGSWWRLARSTMTWGVILGFPTMLTGVLELVLRRLPSRAFPWLMAHVTTIHLALSGYVVSVVMRDEGAPPPEALAIGFRAALLLLVGAACGSMLVLRFGLAARPSLRAAAGPD